ncbi:retropepsin-like aspartic protease [Acidicapsa dinghuensis]|uniref:Retropepsin-like aspartic protease n=1 Tax=Acidicapsa dinghuensis TaxID=2218256 RepID=A0ABW1EMJ9_9BACT|nr:retropepsin-like aspartic protease [Acidicapsa dinghuensis]
MVVWDSWPRKSGLDKPLSHWFLALGWALLPLIAVTFHVHAQEPAKPAPALPPIQLAQPEDAPAPQPSQQPGRAADVRTGSEFGTLSLLNRLERLLADHDFHEMQQVLEDSDSDSHSSSLTPDQKQLFRGVLANRENKPEESIKLLQPLLDKLRTSQPTEEEKLLRKSLAEDYLRAGRWAEANQAYLEYEYRFSKTLTKDERSDIELPIKLLPLVRENPPMAIEAGEPFTLPFDRDGLGLTDVPVFVDGESHDWMLDPTSPFNLVCLSTAKSVGLKLSDASAIVTSLTGHPIKVRATVIPRFTIGTVTYRNMTAFVYDDIDYYFPGSDYRVRGVLGYPAVSALGSITITQNSDIQVQPGQKGERFTGGAPFYLDGDRILTALGKPGDERMFVVDAAGQQTYLTSRYYAEHESSFAGQKMQLLAMPGFTSAPPEPAYVDETTTLQVGKTPLTLHFVQVLTQPMGNAAIDDTYGTLGMDALEELKSYTFDYRTMRFGVKNE